MNRYTSTDTLGRPVDIYWPWGMDLKWSVTLAPAEDLDYSLFGKEITLRIQKKTDATGVYLLDQDTTDGNITVDELTISINIPAADIVAAGIEEGGEYDFSLTIGEPIDGNRIQANFFAVQETGQVPVGCGSYEVGLADVALTVEVVMGPAGVDGVTGPAGPAGPWETTSRLVTTSGPILATDTLVIAQGGGADIELDCPETLAAELWDGVNGRVIVVSRKWADTGIATVTGPADGLPVELFSSPENGGESLWITTYDGIDLVVGDAPFVVQVDGSTTGSGFTSVEFTGADLQDGPVLIGTPTAGRYLFDVDIDIAAELPGVTLLVGILADPDFFLVVGEANKDYTAPIRKISAGEGIYLAGSNISSGNGSGRATITYF